MTYQNPFAPTKAAPRKAGLSKADGDMVARVIARTILKTTKPLTERIEKLEKALEFAQAEAEKAVREHLEAE